MNTEGTQNLDNVHLALYTSAASTFHAPSDYSGTKGMRHERIRASLKWGKTGQSRHDTVFIQGDQSMESISDGLTIARIHQFFSFPLKSKFHTCALIEHFDFVNEDIDELTGMWIVRRQRLNSRQRFEVIPVTQIFRAAHLIPVYGTNPIPSRFSHTKTLDSFNKFYVNRFIDYHAFECAI